jgi:hypothetical protein
LIHDGLALPQKETTETAFNKPPENRHWKVGPGGGGGDAATPRVRPPHDRLRQVGSLVGLGLPCGGASVQLHRKVGFLHFLCLRTSENTSFAMRFLLSFGVFSPVSG